MISSIAAFVVATIAVLVLTPFVRKLALRLGAIDRPGGRRINERPIPRLGGIGVAIAFYIPLALLFAFDTRLANRFFAIPDPTIGLVAGGTLMCLVGAVDDLRGVRALHKLGAQVLAALIAYAAGFRIEAISIPMLPHLELAWMSPVVTTLWIVAVINAINLIDGLDGLAAGVAFFTCTTNFVIATISGDPFVMLLSATLGGATLGFLFFNFNPASVFLGDSGSLFIGYVLATTCILGSSVKSSTTVAILTPLVALGLPIMDTLLAIARRLVERKSIFAADRRHIHHLLLSLGLTHRRAVITLYGMCVFLTAGAIAVSIVRNKDTGLALLVISMVVIGVISAVSVLQQSIQRWQKQERGWGSTVNALRKVLPETLVALRAARDVDAIAAALDRFVANEPLRSAALTKCDSDKLDPLKRLGPAEAKQDDKDLMVVSFPLDAGGGRARLEFAWHNEEPSISSSQANLLLQLVVDACDEALIRCGFEVDASVERPARDRAIVSELRTRDAQRGGAPLVSAVSRSK